MPAEHVAWCRYVDDGNRIVLCDSDSKGAFKVYATPAEAEPDRVRGLVILSALINFADWLNREREINLSAEECGQMVKQFLDAHQAGENYFMQAEQIADALAIPFAPKPVASTRLLEDRRRVYDEATKAREQRWANERVASIPADKCVKCGHGREDFNPSTRICEYDGDGLWENEKGCCGCKCEFLVPDAINYMNLPEGVKIDD